jgi:hypothetical protein
MLALTIVAAAWGVPLAPLQGDWDVVGDYYGGVNLVDRARAAGRLVTYPIRGNQITVDALFRQETLSFTVRPKSGYLEIDLFVFGEDRASIRGVLIHTDDLIIAALERNGKKPRPTTFQTPKANDTHTLIVLKRVKG